MFHINGSRVIRSADVRKDLALIKRDIKQFKKKLPSEQLLKIRGYSVITKISHSEGNLFLLHDKRVLASENYFDRIEFCLNRERSDLMKQNIRSKTGTILLITIDSALSDEVLYSNLKEEDVAHYCHFTHKYQDLFKDIYIYESTGFDRIIKLNELENRVYELLD